MLIGIRFQKLSPASRDNRYWEARSMNWRKDSKNLLQQGNEEEPSGKLSAETHAPINHLHHIDRTDRSVLGLEPPPPAPTADPSVRGAPFTPTTFAVPRTESIVSVPETSSTTVKYARSSRPNTVEGSLIRSGVGSARSVASQAMSMGVDDILTSGASSTATMSRLSALRTSSSLCFSSTMSSPRCTTCSCRNSLSEATTT